MQRVAERELHLEGLDAEQMPGDVPQEEGRDGHGAQVEPADAHARPRDALQVALRDELVPDEAQQLHGSPGQHRRGRRRAAAERAQVRHVRRREREHLVAVGEAQVLDRRRRGQEPLDRGRRVWVRLCGQISPADAAQRKESQRGEAAVAEDAPRGYRAARHAERELERLEMAQRPQRAVEDLQDGLDVLGVRATGPRVGEPAHGDLLDAFCEVRVGEHGLAEGDGLAWDGRGAWDGLGDENVGVEDALGDGVEAAGDANHLGEHVGLQGLEHGREHFVGKRARHLCAGAGRGSQ